MHTDFQGPSLSDSARSLRSSAVRDLLRDARQPDMISLAGGLPDPALFDVEGLDAAWEALRRRGLRETLQYGQTDGEPALREAIADWMRVNGTPAEAGEVLVTTGSQQALDLIARALLDPGDTVIAEQPTYLAALQVFQLTRARIWTLPNDHDGAVVEHLATLPAEHRPKLVYLVTNFANPSGATLSTERRRALLRWAVEHRVFVLEDDPYGPLRFEGVGPPSLRTLCQDIPEASPWVGYASSFSKVLAPGLRIGWLHLPPALRSACVRVKQALDLHTSTLSQALATELLRQDRLVPHLPRLRQAYGERRDQLCNALHRHLGQQVRFVRPAGGMFVWAQLLGTAGRADRVDTTALLPPAKAAGVLFVPGQAFDPHPEAGACADRLRLSFVSASPARLTQGVERLAHALQQLRSQDSGTASGQRNCSSR